MQPHLIVSAEELLHAVAELDVEVEDLLLAGSQLDAVLDVEGEGIDLFLEDLEILFEAGRVLAEHLLQYAL